MTRATSEPAFGKPLNGKGTPLAGQVTAGQVHEAKGFEPVVDAVRIPQPIGRPRTRPYRLAGDNGWNVPSIRQWRRDHRITAIIPEKRDLRGRKPGRSSEGSECAHNPSGLDRVESAELLWGKDGGREVPSPSLGSAGNRSSPSVAASALVGFDEFATPRWRCSSATFFFLPPPRLSFCRPLDQKPGTSTSRWPRPAHGLASASDCPGLGCCPEKSSRVVERLTATYGKEDAVP